MLCCLCFLPAWYIPVPAHFEVPPDLYLPGSGRTAVSAGTADFVYSQTVCFCVLFFDGCTVDCFFCADELWGFCSFVICSSCASVAADGVGVAIFTLFCVLLFFVGGMIGCCCIRVFLFCIAFAVLVLFCEGFSLWCLCDIHYNIRGVFPEFFPRRRASTTTVITRIPTVHPILISHFF